MNRSQFSDSAPGRLVSASGVDSLAFLPDNLPPTGMSVESMAPLLGAILKAEREVARLDGLSHGVSYPWSIARPLMRREAESSSRIENTIASAEEVALYEAGYGIVRNDTVEVANYIVALQHGLHSTLPISRRLICEMHHRLMQGVRGESFRAGQVRVSQNWIAGGANDVASARYVPPPPGQSLEDGIAALERFVNQTPEWMPVVVAVALAHYQFEALHPFDDGNGRVGRAVAALTLCRMGLLSEPLVYVSGYLDRHRQAYYDLLLRVSTHGDWHSWIEFFLSAIMHQARDAGERIGRLRALYDQQRSLLQRGRSAANSMVLLDHLFASPAVTAVSAQQAMRTTDPTARAAISRLEASGLLVESTGRDYGKVWVARPILDIINAEIDTEEASSEADRDVREPEVRN